VLVPVDCSAAVVQLIVEVPALAVGQVAVVKPSIQTLLAVNVGIPAVQAILFAARNLSAPNALPDALVLILKPLVDALRLGRNRQQSRAQKRRRCNNFHTIDFHWYLLIFLAAILATFLLTTQFAKMFTEWGKKKARE